MKSKAKSEEKPAAKPEKPAPQPAAPTEAPKAAAAAPAKPAIPKPLAPKPKIFDKSAQQKPFMPPRGGKGGGGAIRQMRSQRGR